LHVRKNVELKNFKFFESKRAERVYAYARGAGRARARESRRSCAPGRGRPFRLQATLRDKKIACATREGASEDAAGAAAGARALAYT